MDWLYVITKSQYFYVYDLYVHDLFIVIYLITGASRRLEPVIKCCLMSRFQGPAFRCDKIVVIVTLLEAIEGIPDTDYMFGERQLPQS